MSILVYVLIALGLFFCYWMVAYGQIIKNTKYASCCIDYPSSRVPDSFKKDPTFTDQERKAYRLLQKARNHPGIYGEVISRNLGNITNFRKLIVTLKTQGADNPSVMIRIIGEEAWKAINDISDGSFCS